jgi:transcriptional regulator with XRE-family HTH domain
MMIGNELRKLREEQGLFLRQVAAFLEMDSATLSKIERGIKSVRKEHLVKLSEIYKVDESKLVAIWLADKILYIIASEASAVEALEIAKRKILNDDRG